MNQIEFKLNQMESYSNLVGIHSISINLSIRLLPMNILLLAHTCESKFKYWNKYVKLDGFQFFLLRITYRSTKLWMRVDILSKK